MGYCSSCGSEIPDGQGSSCSMCYGDIHYGSDGYYEEWAREQDRKQEENEVETHGFSKDPLKDPDIPF